MGDPLKKGMGLERESVAGPDDPHNFLSAASWATLAKLWCISQDTFKGEETVVTRLARGEEFAVVDDDGLMRILTPREVELSKRVNPEILNQLAFGLEFRELVPKINQLKRRAVFGPGQ